MSYDDSKDKLIKLFEKTNGSGALLVAVMQYNDGDKKLQLSRTYEKKNGEIGYTKSGRLSQDEVQFLLDNGEEIIKLMC